MLADFSYSPVTWHHFLQKEKNNSPNVLKKDHFLRTAILTQNYLRELGGWETKSALNPNSVAPRHHTFSCGTAQKHLTLPQTFSGMILAKAEAPLRWEKNNS